jgi:hypothetical protein
MAQVVKCLPSKHEALSSNSSTAFPPQKTKLNPYPSHHLYLESINISILKSYMK